MHRARKDTQNKIRKKPRNFRRKSVQSTKAETCSIKISNMYIVTVHLAQVGNVIPIKDDAVLSELNEEDVCLISFYISVFSLFTSTKFLQLNQFEVDDKMKTSELIYKL